MRDKRFVFERFFICASPHVRSGGYRSCVVTCGLPSVSCLGPPVGYSRLGEPRSNELSIATNHVRKRLGKGRARDHTKPRSTIQGRKGARPLETTMTHHSERETRCDATARSRHAIPAPSCSGRSCKSARSRDFGMGSGLPWFCVWLVSLPPFTTPHRPGSNHCRKEVR